MRFVIDAHLPKGIAKIFADLGHDAIHTSELPNGNETNDQDIILVAAGDGVVVSKDEDFYQSFLLYGKPPKLIHVKVGNMRLREIGDKLRPEGNFPCLESFSLITRNFLAVLSTVQVRLRFRQFA